MLCATNFQLPNFTASVFRNAQKISPWNTVQKILRSYIKRVEPKVNISKTNEVFDTEELYFGP